jgi:hypothetical protein
MPSAPAPPPCQRLGSQCRALRVTLRASSALAKATSGDHEGTWLLGHTERLSFGRLWKHDGDLFVRATIHVPCKYLADEGEGRARCRAHGFEGPMPGAPARAPQPRRLGQDRFRLVDRGRLVNRQLEPPPPRKPVPVRRALTVLGQANPCATARCRTADNKVGAACCRDLQIEIMCDESWTRQEALIRSRQSPYLCKVVREDEESVEAEVISACDYLGEDNISCTLHGRVRPDGREAKPDLCRRWPKPTHDETLHPGCVFALPTPAAGV